MDNITKVQRSLLMAKIRQKDSKLELRFRKALWANGVRYRKHAKIFGTPDLLVRKFNLIIFIDSCFWHGCRLHCRAPKSNRDFWEAKFLRNRKRDAAVNRHYRARGWTVMRFWEHQLKADFPSCVTKVTAATVISTELRKHRE